MGVFKGGLTIKRFRVEPALPEGFKDEYVKSLAAHRLRPLKPEDEADRAIGWAVAGRLLDTEFDPEKVFWNDYLVCTFRIDSLKLPASLLEAHLLAREEEVAAQRNVEALSRHEKADLKEVVRAELRRRMLPAIKGIDIAWNLGTGRVFIWSQSERVLEEIEDFFLRTFGKQLLREDPYSTGVHMGFDADDKAPLASLPPVYLGTEAG